MSLSDILSQKRKDSLGDDQGRWRQYVLDHLDVIAGISTTFEIDAPLIQLYRYDLKRFLKENRLINEDIAWVVLLLNDMSSDLEFSEPGEYIIPTDRDMQNLFHTFTTISNTAT